MARREWFRTNPYNESLGGAEDKELWCRTRKSTTFAKITEPLIYTRYVGNFTWDRYRKQKQMDALVVARYGPDSIGRLATVAKLGAIQGNSSSTASSSLPDDKMSS